MPDTPNAAPPSASAATAPAPPPNALREVVARATRRVRARLALRAGAWGLLAGAGVSAVLVGLLRGNVLSLNDWPGGEGFLALPVVGGAVLGGLAGLSRRVDPLAVARMLEQRLDLKERLSTAWSLPAPDDARARAHWERQRADAESHAADVGDLRRAVPLTPLPRHAYIALGLAASVFLAWLLPTLPVFQSEARKAERREVKQEGERLLRIAKALEGQADAKKLPQVRRAAEKVRALGKELERGKDSKQQALMKLSKLTQELKEQQQRAAGMTGEPEKGLTAAGRELEKSLRQQSATSPDASRDAKDPAASADAKNAGATPAGEAIREGAEAMKRNDPAALSEQLSRLADQLAKGEPRTAEERERLLRQIEALAKALEGTQLTPSAEALKEAAKALEGKDLSKAAEQLREAARRAGEGQRAREMEEAFRQAAESVRNREQGQQGEQGQQEGEGSPQEGSSPEGQPGGEQGGTPRDGGEGQGAKDAFDGEGNAKKGQGQQQGQGSGSGAGQGQKGQKGGGGKDGKRTVNGTGNSVGEGHSAPGVGKKAAAKEAGAYQDPTGAKTGAYDGDWRVNKVRNDESARLYVPKNDTRVSGKRGEKGKESVTFFRGAPDRRDAATPYFEVYEQYAPAAESALNREDIPATYKKQVKDYFDSLRPASGGPKQ